MKLELLEVREESFFFLDPNKKCIEPNLLTLFIHQNEIDNTRVKCVECVLNCSTMQNVVKMH